METIVLTCTSTAAVSVGLPPCSAAPTLPAGQTLSLLPVGPSPRASVWPRKRPKRVPTSSGPTPTDTTSTLSRSRGKSGNSGRLCSASTAPPLSAPRPPHQLSGPTAISLGHGRRKHSSIGSMSTIAPADAFAPTASPQGPVPLTCQPVIFLGRSDFGPILDRFSQAGRQPGHSWQHPGGGATCRMAKETVKFRSGSSLKVAATLLAEFEVQPVAPRNPSDWKQEATNGHCGPVSLCTPNVRSAIPIHGWGLLVIRHSSDREEPGPAFGARFFLLNQGSSTMTLRHHQPWCQKTRFVRLTETLKQE
jgi:hypothetical protein